MNNECVTIGAKAKFQVTDRSNPSTRSSWQVILPLALLYALVNLFAFQIVQWVSEGSPREYLRLRFWGNIALAFMASEVAVLSMVLVFAPLPFIRRLALYWGAGTLLSACWLIGIGIAPFGFPSRLGIGIAPFGFPSQLTGEEVALSLPLAALVCQAPLWVLRLCFGWRWQGNSDTLADSKVRWALKDLLAGMALIALSLSLARLVDHDRMRWMHWVEFSVYGSVFSLFAIGPAMYLTLRGWSWRVGALVFLVYATVGGFYIAIHGGFVWFWRQPAVLLSGSIPTLLSFATGLLLATLVARSLGCRLVSWPAGRR